jgi:hypothetical protein
MKSVYIERAWPYIAALLALAVWWFSGKPFPPKPDPLMGASGTVAAVLIGFLGTAKAIILGMTGSEVFKRLKDAGYTALLYAYLYEALFAGSVFLVVSVVGFFLAENEPHPCFGATWVLTGILSLALYVRVTSLLFKLIRKA